jgi:hypothetical protein
VGFKNVVSVSLLSNWGFLESVTSRARCGKYRGLGVWGLGLGFRV